MYLSPIIITITFITMLILIGTGKADRTKVAIIATLITYFVLTFLETLPFEAIAGFIIGTPDDDYVNLRTILLLFSLLIIVQISREAGVFQYLAFKVVQLTRGRPKYLIATFSILTVLVTAILSDLLAIIILIPLTITACRILRLNPIPYITAQILIVKVGAVILMTSSVANIVISLQAGLYYVPFFLNIGLIGLTLLPITIGIFYLAFRKDLQEIPHNVDILLAYNPWIFVPNRALMMKSVVTIIALIIAMIVIPYTILPPSIITFTCAAILLAISKKNPAEIIPKIDFKLLIYLICVFIVTGGLETTGVIPFLADAIGGLNFDNSFTVFIFILWISGYFSGPIDNIAIMRVLIPITDLLTRGYSLAEIHLAYSGLIFGINLGDNLTPMGDSMIGITIAQENKYPINIRKFFVIGFTLTNLQFYLIMVFYALLYQTLLGILLLMPIVGITLIIIWKVKKSHKGTKGS